MFGRESSNSNIKITSKIHRFYHILYLAYVFIHYILSNSWFYDLLLPINSKNRGTSKWSLGWNQFKRFQKIYIYRFCCSLWHCIIPKWFGNKMLGTDWWLTISYFQTQFIQFYIKPCSNVLAKMLFLTNWGPISG